MRQGVRSAAGAIMPFASKALLPLLLLGLLRATSSTLAQTCRNGVPGVEAYNQCCRIECGTCGGTGCKDRAEAVYLTADDCCSTRIRQNNVRCEDNGMQAPCYIGTGGACPDGTNLCNDPHLMGLRGQHFEWHGVDGGWYCLVKDEEVDLQVNVRPTAPLPVDFPERQYITGISVLSGGHSLVIEVKDPYSGETGFCPDSVSPCLADGGLRVLIDGEEVDELLSPLRDEFVAGDIEMSSTNLPVECREFGGSKIWAQTLRKLRLDQRSLAHESFEEWILSFDNTVAPDWCAKFVNDHGLVDLQSNQSVFRIATPSAVVRFSVGVNHRPGGKVNRFGRSLPELDFWQTGAGVEGLSEDHQYLTGILGETARPTIDAAGNEVMEGLGVLRGSIEDFRVASAVGTDFAFLHKEGN